MTAAASYLRHVWLTAIPHPHNDHRPYALRHGPLAAMSALLIAAKVVAVGIIALTPATADLSTITTARIIQLTNAERKKAGLSELTSNSLLGSAATQKGNHMLEEDYFAHISPDGVTPWFWMNKVGYSYKVAGENLAVDFTEAEDVVAAWMASPSHKENLLLPEYTEIGVGVITGEFQGGTSTIVVQMFGLPALASAKAGPTSSQVAAKVSQPKKPSPSPTLVPTPISTPPQPSPWPSPSPTPIPAPSVSPAPRPPRIALLGPTTDQPQIAWQLPDGRYTMFPATILPWQPHFAASAEQSSLAAPARFSQLTQRIAASLAVAITILLALAIFIRIRIQHPALIAHASFVALLATILLFL